LTALHLMTALYNLEIMSRKHALEIFRGPLPPQRSAFTENGDSSLFFVENRELSLIFRERSEAVQGRKMSSVPRERDFQGVLKL